MKQESTEERRTRLVTSRHVRERTIPTGRPLLVGQVSANVLRIEGVAWPVQRIATAIFLII
jgi:hypothetical protein